MFGKSNEAPFFQSLIGSLVINKANRGVRISHYYFWIKHVIYFDESVRKPVKKLVFCCAQESIDAYCIKKNKYRDFAIVESFPIQKNNTTG